MRFETSQQMRLGQQMKLAPRMIQSMEILQMPLAELEERIEQELESNPTLELAEIEPGAIEAEPRDEHAETNADDFERLDDFAEANPDASDNEFDGPTRAEGYDDYEPRLSRSRLDGEPDAKMEAMAAAPARSASLQEQLLEQWRVVEVTEHLRPLGEVIIGFLEEDGYLRVPLAEVRDRASRPEGVPRRAPWPPPIEDLELALQAVQLLLEPAGVAARDARECLLLQLDAQLDLHMPHPSANGNARGEGSAVADAATLGRARLLVERHLDDLLNNRLPRIASATGLTLEEIKGAIGALRRLSLAPARRLVEERVATVTPDAIVEYDEERDRYVAYLNDTRLPSLRINREYALLSKDSGIEKRDREFLKKNLSNAQWLLDAVEQRRGTLLRVVNTVLTEQRDYFDYGESAIRPLDMTGVAERLGVHVATVSRAVSEKYLQTPRGIVPLRMFFTGGLSTESGEDMSQAAVKAALQELIDGEEKSRPLSDDALAKALNDRGIEIARRTVAKYRGLLDIPSARLRKQF